MYLKKTIYLSIIFIIGCCFTSCKDESDDPKGESFNVSDNIIGNWLIASSNAEEWLTYEFTETSRINAKFLENQKQAEGSGYYWVNNEKNSLTGNYKLENGNVIYLDWIIETIQPFEISFKLFDNNDYIGSSSLYRILSSVTLTANDTQSINFKAICGTDDVNDIKVIDSNVATVTNNGELTGKAKGETFLTFNTANGHAAVKLEINTSVIF